MSTSPLYPSSILTCMWMSWHPTQRCLFRCWWMGWSKEGQEILRPSSMLGLGSQVMVFIEFHCSDRDWLSTSIGAWGVGTLNGISPPLLYGRIPELISFWHYDSTVTTWACAAIPEASPTVVLGTPCPANLWVAPMVIKTSSSLQSCLTELLYISQHYFNIKWESGTIRQSRPSPSRNFRSYLTNVFVQ